MIPLTVIAVLPPAGGTPESQARAVLEALADRLGATGGGLDRALALTFFVDAVDADTFERAADALRGLVRERFGGDPPPASVVAQPPEGGRAVALEARVLAPSADGPRVERTSVGGLPYTVVEGGGARQVHAGVFSPAAGPGDAAAQAEAAFARMQAVLDREGLDYGHVVRQWNFIENVLAVDRGADGVRQRYQEFNEARARAYGRSGFPAGYPAATGIGQAAGGIAIEFIALSAPPGARVAPISNPRQVDAHRYSGGVLVGDPRAGEPRNSAPKFERAKLVALGGEEVVFISGTAAILGEVSVAPGDIEAQMETTKENIAVLLPERSLTYLRAYVKRAEDIPAVRRSCEAAWGPIPMLFVRADVCREELLVEVEGMLAGPCFPSTGT